MVEASVLFECCDDVFEWARIVTHYHGLLTFSYDGFIIDGKSFLKIMEVGSDKIYYLKYSDDDENKLQKFIKDIERFVI